MKSRILIWCRNFLIGISVLVLVGVFLIDAFFGFSFSNIIKAHIRQIYYADKFADTYRLGAAWPIEGGEPIKLKISFVYNQKRNLVERTLRCHQEKQWGWNARNDFVWRQHMSLTSISLDDGAMLLIELPKICDIDLGWRMDAPRKYQPYGIWYLDDAQAPGYLIKYNNAIYNGGIALSNSVGLFDPRSLTITTVIPDEETIQYSTNEAHKNFGWSEDHPWKNYFSNYFDEAEKAPKRVFTTLSGEIYFQAQFEKSEEIRALIENATEPVIIPRALLFITSFRYRENDSAIDQFHEFLSDNDLEAVRSEKIVNPTIHFTLVDNNVWIPDFSTIGIKKYFFRRSCNAQDDCYFKSSDFEDKIKFGSIILDVHSPEAVYLPDKNIIINPYNLLPKRVPLLRGDK